LWRKKALTADELICKSCPVPRKKISSKPSGPSCSRPRFWKSREANFWAEREENVATVHEAIGILSDCRCDRCITDISTIVQAILRTTGELGAGFAIGEALHLLCVRREFSLAKSIVRALMPKNNLHALREIEKAQARMQRMN
jgi:hypothetical protein